MLLAKKVLFKKHLGHYMAWLAVITVGLLAVVVYDLRIEFFILRGVSLQDKTAIYSKLYGAHTDKRLLSSLQPISDSLLEYEDKYHFHIKRSWFDGVVIQATPKTDHIAKSQVSRSVCPSSRALALVYQQHLERVLQPFGLALRTFVMTCAQTVRMSLLGGMRIYLGSAIQSNGKLLSVLLENWRSRLQHIQSIDMRYQQGVSVRWR